MPSSKYEPKHLKDVKISDLKTLGGKTENEAAYVPKGGTVTRMGGQNIVTVEVPKNKTVESFEPGKLQDTRGVRYSSVLGGISDHTIKKNARFRISELTRGPLSVEAEEEQKIEDEVQRRLQTKLQELRDITTAKAYEEGFAAGKTDGRSEVTDQSKPKLAAFETMLSQFENMKFELFKANEEFLIRMIYRLAKAVILRELQEDHDYTKRLVTQILERIGTRENIKIFVNETEYSSAEELKQGLAQSLGQLKNISIELDPDISNKGCRVETEFGEVDARIEVQIQSIEQALGVTKS